MRRFLITGMVVLLPVMASLYLIWLFFSFFDHLFAPVGQYLFGRPLPGVGVFLTLLLVLGTGMLATNFLGRRVIDLVGCLLARLPLVGSIYRAMKQIVDAFSQPHQTAFKRVVLVEYPRQGCYTIGFFTGWPKGELAMMGDEQLVSVFLPTTPNPTSGWLLLLPERDSTYLQRPVEEGLKLVISGGVTAARAREMAVVQPGGRMGTC
jgi:uncharacterized membrane protein